MTLHQPPARAPGAAESSPEVDPIGRLHRGVVERPSEVRALLEQIVEGPSLRFTGLDERADIGSATILWVDLDSVGLRAPGLRFDRQPQVHFQFDGETGRYFFAARPRRGGEGDLLEIDLPAAIYTAERRMARRRAHETARGGPREVVLGEPDLAVTAHVCDWSEQGLGVALPPGDIAGLRFPVEIRYLDGPRRGSVAYASLRSRRPSEDDEGLVRLGLSVSGVPFGPQVPVDRHAPAPERGGRAWKTIPIAARTARADRVDWQCDVAGAGEARVEMLEYDNDRGEPIRAIVDTTGDVRGATAVVIPPSWGRTKERTLPLAATLIETFERAGEPLAVLRFDGTHRSGESFIDPRFRTPGDEYLGFTFSQAARDIQATFDFLERSERFAASKIVLVTFSLGAVEGRRALAASPSERLAGWVSVVGMADLQSGLRTVSGGVDYGHGLLQGVHFGEQELVGVVADMDFTGHDAIDHGMMFLEDARRDMANIEVPVTWLHGRHDAWMELSRVQELLSTGHAANRRLIEIPCGHQVRTSREARETFRRVASEASEMALGRALEPVTPDLRRFVRRERAERERLAAEEPDLRAFWRDYLLGRDESLGIELLTATRAYSELMGLQLRELAVRSGQRIVDLGAGVGDFAVGLAQRAEPGERFRIVALDLVPEALKRGRMRLEEELRLAGGPPQTRLGAMAADLDVSNGRHIPLSDASADRVIASLLISYLAHPAHLLAEMKRILRPGGRLVLSTLRRDADISKLYVEGIAELLPDRMRKHFGKLGNEQVSQLQRRFLNDAARLLTLEESGSFRFWDADELEEMARAAGLRDIRIQPSFGQPAQALVLSAVAP